MKLRYCARPLSSPLVVFRFQLAIADSERVLSYEMEEGEDSSNLPQAPRGLKVHLGAQLWTDHHPSGE